LHLGIVDLAEGFEGGFGRDGHGAARVRAGRRPRQQKGFRCATGICRERPRARAAQRSGKRLSPLARSRRSIELTRLSPAAELVAGVVIREVALVIVRVARLRAEVLVEAGAVLVAG